MINNGIFSSRVSLNPVVVSITIRVFINKRRTIPYTVERRLSRNAPHAYIFSIFMRAVTKSINMGSTVTMPLGLFFTVNQTSRGSYSTKQLSNICDIALLL